MINKIKIYFKTKKENKIKRLYQQMDVERIMSFEDFKNLYESM